MNYKCCKYIRHGIVFTRTGIRLCNKLSAIGKIADLIPYNKNFYKEFIQIKADTIENFRQGKIPQHCQNCIYLEDKDWDNENTKINEIEMFHWNQCNCACIYCAERNETKLKITEKKVKGNIDLYKTLKLFVKEKYFDDDVNVAFGGGEPTILKEFPDILKLFMKQNYKMHILTNGILYEKLFSKFLKYSEKDFITISLDCGSEEMYRKIKGVDKFKDVTNNIRRYIKEAGENSKNLFIKYILLENLNDNEEEIIKWLEICKDMGVKTLHPTIEFCHSFKDPAKKGPSDHICDMYNFMKVKITEYGFNLNTYDFVDVIVKKKSYR